ncbi:MAG: hypothetical protein IRY85_20525 [Micromonosporaceae bacterium]|nr:hypothetical protein [Micromonosporaceae bacterium]
MRRLLPLALLPVLLLAACAQPASPGATDRGGARTNYRPDEVVLRIEYVGGFVAAQTLATRLPVVTIYGDGRVITEGPVIAIYPGPALPNILERRIGAADMNRLVTMAVEAGVGADIDYGTPSVTDLPETKFTVSTTDGVLTSTVYALDIDEGLTAAQITARQKLRDLKDALTDLPGTLGADAAGEERPYEPVALAAVTSPFVGSEEGLDQPEAAWPGPALPGEPLGSLPDLRCLTVTGDDLAAVLEAAAGATTLTPWVWEGERWFVSFRPLLPDESTCADLNK